MISRSYHWAWNGTDYAHPRTDFAILRKEANHFHGIPGSTGHIDVYIERDHETQDPPPPGAVPVSTFVELMAMPERYIIKKKLSSTGGFVRFPSLDPTRTYLVFSLGIPKGDGSGEWYVAEMYDRLIPTPD